MEELRETYIDLRSNHLHLRRAMIEYACTSSIDDYLVRNNSPCVSKHDFDVDAVLYLVGMSHA